jgi:xylulokinase
MPHFGGAGAPYWDHSCTGAFVGFSLGHTQAHVVRAILEGVAMQIRTNVESALWTGIIGDVLGKPQVRIKQTEVGTLGAAMLAGLGVGLFADVGEAVRVMTPICSRRDFDPANHAVYEQLREQYMAMSQRIYGSPVEEWTGVIASDLDSP